MAKIKWDFEADDRDAAAKWDNQSRKARELKGTVQDVGEAGEKAGGDMEASFTRAGVQVELIAQGFDLAKQALTALIAEHERFKEATVDADAVVDTAFRRLNLQTGLSGSDVEREVTEQAIAFGTTTEAAAATVQQLGSSGFSPQEALKSLDTALALQAGTDAVGKDPRGLAKANAVFLSATDQELTEENLARVSVAEQRLFKGTNLQPDSVGLVAGEASGLLAQGVPPLDQLTLQSIALDFTSEAGPAATGLGNFFKSLAGVREGTVQAQALADLGTSSEELAGVGFEERIQAISEGAAGLSVSKRDEVFKTLFGTSGFSFATKFATPETLKNWMSGVPCSMTSKVSPINVNLTSGY